MTEKKHGYLTLYICIGIVAAILMAIFAPHTATKTRIGGEIFLNLLKMIVVPLVMTSVLSGILGMGDVMSLIEKASEQASAEESLKLHKKLKKNQFTLADFLNQLRMMKKMGSIGSLMKMIPGMDKMAKNVDTDAAEKELKYVEAIILSMTKKERNNPNIIDGSRRKRIAAGSGTRVQDVNKLLKNFLQMKKMMKQLNKGGMGNLMKGLTGGNPMGMLK